MAKMATDPGGRLARSVDSGTRAIVDSGTRSSIDSGTRAMEYRIVGYLLSPVVVVVVASGTAKTETQQGTMGARWRLGRDDRSSLARLTDGVAATAADDHCLDGAAHHDGTSFAHSRLPAARGNTSFISIGVVVSNSSRVGMSTMSG